MNAGSGTRWQIYSTNPTLNTAGGLTPGFIQYNAAYGATPAQASGIRRDRSIAAAVNLAARMGGEREDTARQNDPPALVKMDATLIHSLSRLRNHIRSSTRVTT